MSRNSRVSMLAALSVLTVPLALPAQPEAQRVLSEQAAVQAAVARNPTLHVALLRATQSRYLLRAEEALYTPIFDANAGVTHTRSPSLSGSDAVRIGTSDSIDVGMGLSKGFSFGTVVSASVAGQRFLRSGSDQLLFGGSSGPGYALTGQLALSQPLLRGAGNDVGLASRRQARLSLEASQLAAQQTASALLADVVSAYWELWYSAEVVRINQASRELARVQQEQARQQVESGALAPASALPYATQLAELDEAVLSASTEVRQRELVLGQLLGNPGAVGERLSAGDAPQLPAADEPVEARAVAEALANSYAQKQLRAQLAIAKDQLKVSGDPLRPRLDVDAYVQAQGLGNRRVPPAFEQFGKMEAVSAHVGLTFETPITDTRRTAQVQAAQLSAHISEKQILENEMAIRSTVAAAVARRRAARERLALSTQTEKVARQQAEAERARFQAGSSIAISVQQAEDSLRQAQLRAQRARIDLVLADLELSELRGQLLDRYAGVLRGLPAVQGADLSNAPSGNF